ncbi:MAG: 3-hydroxyacyl-CoA dehydrogenase NAD-binding domain-containing protein [Gammaproteobacteria bacterium]
MNKPVSLERRGPIGLITIDNPPVNALSHGVRAGICETLDAAVADNEIHAIVLACSGRTFIAGADIREFGKPLQDPWLPEVLAQLEAVDKPTVAALFGTVLGGGLETAMCCHYRVALSTTRLGLPEVNLGLLPGAGGTQRLPRLVGAPYALDIMVGGKPVDANSAHQNGLVDEIVSDDVLAAATAFAQRLVDDGEGPRRTGDRPVEPVADDFFANYRAKIARRARGFNSPWRIVECVEAAVSKPLDEGLKLERELFLQCRDSNQSASMRHLFFAERTVARIPDVPKNTPARDIRQVAIIGAGTMGSGIALACLNAGFDVRLLDLDRQTLERGRESIVKGLDAAVARGRIDQTDRDKCIDQLVLVDEYEALSEADLVIEAVFESMSVKEDVFSRLDSVCRPGALLATNTSTLSIDRISAATTRPEDVIGLHFFSPAHIMRLLEIVRGSATSTDVIASSMQFAKRLRKIGVVVGNCFGFVGNRMLYGYGRENQLLLLEGAAPEYIDQVLHDWGMAMGPNAVGDLAGLDVGYKVRQERTDLPDDPRYYRMADVLAGLGRFGQKTGRGMYLYEEGSRIPVPDPEVSELIRTEAEALGVEQRDIGQQEIIERCVYALVVEGTRILEEGIALRASDIDVVWANGYGFPRFRGGPMFYADTVGLDKVYETVCRFRDQLGEQYWKPPELLKKLALEGGTFAALDED